MDHGPWTKKLLLLCCCCWASLYMAAGQSLHYRNHALEEAFPGVRASLVYTAPDGWVWIGANEGLLRYDGEYFELFRLPDSLSNNEVSAVYQDRRRRLWVGFRDGAVAYLEGKNLRYWEPEEGLPKVAITGFAEDRLGRLWFATYGEGLYYRGRNGRLYNINADDGLLGDDLYVLVADQHGRLWAGTDHGINICQVDERGRRRLGQVTRAEGLPDDIVRALRFDDSGGLWIGGYDRGVCRYDTSGRKFQQPIPNWTQGVVNTLALFEERELWIGTEDQGLWRLSLQPGQDSLLSEPAFRDAKILNLQTDQEGHLWTLSSTHGLFSANRHFEHFPGDGSPTQALLVDRRQTLWIGTAEGLYRVVAGRRQPVQVLGPMNVLSLYEDSFGNIWMGSFGDGVICFDPVSGRRRHIGEPEGLTNGSILDIDGRGQKIWLATLGGVTEFDCRENPLSGGALPHRNFNRESELGTNFIYTVLVDRLGRTWFGTDGKGLAVLQNGRLSRYPEANGRQLGAVHALVEDRRGHIWFSTAHEGLLEFDGRRFRSMGAAEGLRDPQISTLAVDGRGHILIVHPKGIDVLDPQSRQMVRYGKESGLFKTESNLNAVAADQQGRLWIGAPGELLRYTPLPDAARRGPAVGLSAISVLSRAVPPDQPGRFLHHENHFLFQYAGLWYTDPGQLRFRYKLEGHDLNWVVSRDRQVLYSSLPPGDYRFLVSASVDEDFERSPPAEYPFVIRQPFWQTWWFISGSLLLGLSLFITLMLQRERRLERVARLQREKVESQYEALKSQINPHFLFNSFNTLVAIIEEDRELAVEFVEKLADFYRRILQYREKEVILLEDELDLVEDYLFLLRKRFGENLQLRVAVDGARGSGIPPFALQLLVENAVKHNVIAAGRPLLIDISSNGDGYLKVRNNIQEKWTQEPSTGFGLSSISQRYRLLSEKPVQVERGPGGFEVRLPILKQPSP